MAMGLVSPQVIAGLSDKNPFELLQMKYSLSDSSCSYYVRVMLAYYLNAPEELRRIIVELENEDEHQGLLAMSKLRVTLLNKNTSLADIDLTLEKSVESPWKGDILLCCGLAFSRIGQYEQALSCTLKGSEMLKRAGSTKKSLMGFLNGVTLFGLIHPDEKLMQNYYQVINIAKESQANAVMSNCYLNIADEYYKLGAFYSALEAIEAGIKCLSQEDGSNQILQAKALNAEVLFRLNRELEANKLLDELSKCQNSEVLECVKVIRLIHHGLKEKIDAAKLTPSFRLKLENRNITALGKTEDELVNFLAKGVRNTDEILSKLYPAVDEGDAFNRLTTMVHRINKKADNAIEYIQKTNRYQLSNNKVISC